MVAAASLLIPPTLRAEAVLLGEDEVTRLDQDAVRGITHVGGTILGTTNRGNPFEWPRHHPDGHIEIVDRSLPLAGRPT